MAKAKSKLKKRALVVPFDKVTPLEQLKAFCKELDEAVDEVFEHTDLEFETTVGEFETSTICRYVIGELPSSELSDRLDAAFWVAKETAFKRDMARREGKTGE